MRKQTFIDNMTERGYELRNVRNGNMTARKGDIAIRWIKLANHGVYIDTPTVTAITDENATDEETMRIIDALTA